MKRFKKLVLYFLLPLPVIDVTITHRLLADLSGVDELAEATS